MMIFFAPARKNAVITVDIGVFLYYLLNFLASRGKNLKPMFFDFCGGGGWPGGAGPLSDA